MALICSLYLVRNDRPFCSMYCAIKLPAEQHVIRTQVTHMHTNGQHTPSPVVHTRQCGLYVFMCLIWNVLKLNNFNSVTEIVGIAYALTSINEVLIP
jgi:hypothetical protein